MSNLGGDAKLKNLIDHYVTRLAIAMGVMLIADWFLRMPIDRWAFVAAGGKGLLTALVVLVAPKASFALLSGFISTLFIPERRLSTGSVLLAVWFVWLWWWEISGGFWVSGELLSYAVAFGAYAVAVAMYVLGSWLGVRISQAKPARESFRT